MKKTLIILISIFAMQMAHAKHSAVIDSANAYYKNAKYEQAIKAYNSVIDDGYVSAELYYNLGNSYYKSNKIALAIASYERSLKLNPNDENTLFNLKMANTYVVDKIDVIPEFFLKSWTSKVTGLFQSNTWAVISIVCFVAFLLFLVLFFFSGNMALRKVVFALSIVAIILVIFSFSFARIQKNEALSEPSAIVLTPSVVVKSSPDQSGTELFLIHEGLKVKVMKELGDWREIKLSDGKRGWLQIKDLIVIE